MITYSFESLVVWKEAKMLTIAVYTVTRSFPSEEKFGLVSQLRRASTSICSNIAEGSGRKHGKDQAHFYNIAYGSLMEVLSASLIACEFKWIQEEEMIELRKKVEGISLKLKKLCKSCSDRSQTSKPSNAQT